MLQLELHRERELKALLETHLMPSEGTDYLLTDDIRGFGGARKTAIHGETERLTEL